MKIIFLNIWGGQIFNPLVEFIKANIPETDFFCFQEVLDSPVAATTPWGGLTNVRAKLWGAIPELKTLYQSFYAPSLCEWEDKKTYPMGPLTLAKRTFPIEAHGEIPIHNGVSTSRDFQYVCFTHEQKTYTLCNLHGASVPGSKLDTPERLEQSKRIIEFLGRQKGEKIVGGDFNLLPQTESIRMIEHAGMRNLVAEYGIRTTRSELSYQKYPESKRQYFSDYVFVSPGIQVVHFEVPQAEISDHLPLLLEFH